MSRTYPFVVSIVFVIGFLYVGCTQPERKPMMEESAIDIQETEEVEEVETEVGKAVRFAHELWDTMQTAEYQENWHMWPGKEAFYSGTRPHGTLLTTYVNNTAYDAIVNGEEQLSNGSIIIKENYTPDKNLTTLTVMEKKEGYNPDDNNWFWVAYSPDGSIKMAGKVDACISCHGKESDNDYIFTSTLDEEYEEEFEFFEED
ncbi:MAG: hypothetical protein E3K32_09410 [wastewater metagenome]|nr:hypothetical protein [Candidatus Loosdrechtia aerotolerans]